MQFPGKSAPADLYGGEWTNVSSQFAGQFFRAEGGNAAEFGSGQNAGIPNIYGYFTSWAGGADNGLFTVYGNSGSAMYGASGRQTFNNIYLSAARYNGYYGASDEPRPYNTAIRIWEKTG